MKQTHFAKNRLAQAIFIGLAFNLAACSNDETLVVDEQIVQEVADEVAGDVVEQLTPEAEVIVAKPAMPAGLGAEYIADIPNVSDPLPAITYVNRNDGNGRFYRDTNPINYALRGINDVWRGTTEQWQTTAGDYTDEANLYKAGDGPNPHNAANGRASDYVPEGTEIVDAATWEANIQYVVEVTTNRTDEQALYAFLDDVRSKNYSTIDGFGPLTEDYAANSGAYASFQPILVSDVTENSRYNPDDNDSFSTYGGQIDTPLGGVVQLASRFRNSAASTSGPKYLYATPRPWRMTDKGEIDFQSVETLNCVDGASETREVKEYRIDAYTSSVNVIPGLVCGRRAHSSSKEAELLYTATTENRRKDNGYPSGHTNAGVLASLAYAYALPERFAEHVARGLELGENRIVAGMHSPVDVIGGRIQATMVAAYALAENPDEAAAAYQNARDYFGPKAEALGMSLYQYAHRNVEEGSFVEGDQVNVNVFNNNRYSDYEAMKANYSFRLTYGLPQTGTPGLAPIVPEGAEALLKTRLPYLDKAQRRAVLATTEVDSGYPLLDKTNGWGRLNLVAAADGYGAFLGDVTVSMDASDGGYSAKDWWRNDISGEGKLTKSGSGELTLTGNNSYSGGTVVAGGTLEAASPSAFGLGDLYLQSGEVEVNADGALALSGNLTVDAGELRVKMDTDTAQVEVAKTAYIDGGQLTLDFTEVSLTEATSFTVLSSETLYGEFDKVAIIGDGYSFTLEYTETEVIAHLAL